ncbi:toxin-antitoxin system YwqK family antitoxin [Hymenobacter convexus]|uniref:toxin-antitoxin system YwqK family antitoxin n=1 Tax=Hymenobacter sp. CA1UV-4 TaxID=3063782 RepID=UPI0027141655|nr:hypothetical protein [Hymenobacter sp. CA1UV-4]MDO7854711.1 hypothetical protein [Hymenobacter sp. CA1UV-4]
MPRFYTCAAVLTLFLTATAAHAQSGRPLRIVTYYDSARTQRRAVYGAQLTGAHPDTLAHGPFRRFRRTGSLEELGHFTNGLADSIWTRYYPARAGQPPAVARRLPMRAGQPDGLFVVFHADGRVAQRGTFRRGQLVDSLVTTTQTGSPRLLARFDSSRAPGLRGSFRHWGGSYTAHSLAIDWFINQGQGLSDDNPYPRRDSARYWTGQLAAGRLVGAFTERDADGEPRARLVYTARGQWRLSTLYYPAAWLRHEQSQDTLLPADSVVHSRPRYEWEPVGRRPHLLQRYWDFSYGATADVAHVELFKTVTFLPRHPLINGDVVGVASRPAQSAFPVPAPVPAPRPAECRVRRAGSASANGQDAYPPPSHYRLPVSLQKQGSPGRWRLGADTTGTARRPARHRETVLPNGRRVVETPFVSRTYSPKGQLVEVTHWRFGGRQLERSYYANGHRESVTRKGWLASYSRGWNEADKRISNDLNRLVGIRVVEVRKQVTRHGKKEMRNRIQLRFRKSRGNIHFR